MSKIKKEVEECLIDVSTSGRTLTSRFVFPPEFIGFQGHFPAKLVLPGACQIQCVLTSIEKANEMTAGIKEIVLAKYFTPVFPNEELTCSVSGAAGEDPEPTIKALLTKNAVKVAELKLRVTLKAGRKKHRNA